MRTSHRRSVGPRYCIGKGRGKLNGQHLEAERGWGRFFALQGAVPVHFTLGHHTLHEACSGSAGRRGLDSPHGRSVEYRLAPRRDGGEVYGRQRETHSILPPSVTGNAFAFQATYLTMVKLLIGHAVAERSPRALRDNSVRPPRGGGSYLADMLPSRCSGSPAILRPCPRFPYTVTSQIVPASGFPTATASSHEPDWFAFPTARRQGLASTFCGARPLARPTLRDRGHRPPP